MARMRDKIAHFYFGNETNSNAQNPKPAKTCDVVRTLRVKRIGRGWEQRIPAIPAGLTDRVWSIDEWLTYPVRGN